MDESECCIVTLVLKGGNYCYCTCDDQFREVPSAPCRENNELVMVAIAMLYCYTL